MNQKEYEEFKELKIKEVMGSIENRIRHTFNSGFECGKLVASESVCKSKCKDNDKQGSKVLDIAKYNLDFYPDEDFAFLAHAIGGVIRQGGSTEFPSDEELEHDGELLHVTRQDDETSLHYFLELRERIEDIIGYFADKQEEDSEEENPDMLEMILDTLSSVRKILDEDPHGHEGRE